MTDPVPPSTLQFAVVEVVPLELPAGWTQQRVDEHGAARMRALATQHARDVVSDVVRVEEVPVVERGDDWAPATGGQAPEALRIKWVADTAPKPPPIASTTVQAFEQEEGIWAADLPAGVTTIVSVRHGLDTEAVTVDASVLGAKVTYQAATPITRGEVEVILGGPTDRLVVRPAEDEEDRP